MRYLLLIFSVLYSLTAVAQSGTRWYKGNTHTHTLWSDGDDFPELVLDWYKSRGYDFIALSDHNTLADIAYWKEVPSHPFRQERFREYLKKYGDEWVEQKTDSAGKISVRLKTLKEFRPLFEEEGKFLIIQAEEVSDKFGDKPIHMNILNVKELLLPKGGNSVAEVMQNNLDAVYEQRERTGQPMIPHINHPNFVWAIKADDMRGLRGERFFEVYNGHPLVHNYGDSTTFGMDELWDNLLISYLRDGKPPLYGLATDDSHHYLEYKVGLSNPGRGWIMVKAENLTPNSLIAALENGEFYATSGVLLEDLQKDKGTLSIQVAARPDAKYTIQFWGARRSNAQSDSRGAQPTKYHKESEPVRMLLKEVKGTQAHYTLTANDMYVRAKIISDTPQKNPYQEGDVETAWTQPLVRK